MTKYYTVDIFQFTWECEQSLVCFPGSSEHIVSLSMLRWTVAGREEGVSVRDQSSYSQGCLIKAAWNIHMKRFHFLLFEPLLDKRLLIERQSDVSVFTLNDKSQFLVVTSTTYILCSTERQITLGFFLLSCVAPCSSCRFFPLQVLHNNLTQSLEIRFQFGSLQLKAEFVILSISFFSPPLLSCTWLHIKDTYAQPAAALPDPCVVLCAQEDQLTGTGGESIPDRGDQMTTSAMLVSFSFYRERLLICLRRGVTLDGIRKPNYVTNWIHQCFFFCVCVFDLQANGTVKT